MPFTFKKLSIPDVLLIEPKVFPDSRGYFAEVYKDADFAEVGITKPIAQIITRNPKRMFCVGYIIKKTPKPKVS